MSSSRLCENVVFLNSSGTRDSFQCKLVFVWSGIKRLSGIVTRGDQQVCEDQQLIIRELLLVLLPVVMMSPSEVGKGFLHSHLNGLGVIKVGTQVHQQLGHPGGNIIWTGEKIGRAHV